MTPKGTLPVTHSWRSWISASLVFKWSNKNLHYFTTKRNLVTSVQTTSYKVLNTFATLRQGRWVHDTVLSNAKIIVVWVKSSRVKKRPWMTVLFQKLRIAVVWQREQLRDQLPCVILLFQRETVAWLHVLEWYFTLHSPDSGWLTKQHGTATPSKLWYKMFWCETALTKAVWAKKRQHFSTHCNLTKRAIVILQFSPAFQNWLHCLYCCRECNFYVKA